MGSGAGAEQAAANEKQVESPASLPPPPVLSQSSGSDCIFFSPDCREIGGLCASGFWCSLKQREPDMDLGLGLGMVGDCSGTLHPG